MAPGIITKGIALDKYNISLFVKHKLEGVTYFWAKMSKFGIYSADITVLLLNKSSFLV